MASVGDINRIGGTTTDGNTVAVPLGKISSWEAKKSASIMPIPFPGKNSSDTLAVDSLGTISYINITGRITGEFQFLQTTVSTLKLIIDGNQGSALSIFSPFVNEVAVILNGIAELYELRKGDIGLVTGVASAGLKITGTSPFAANGIKAGDWVKNLRNGQVSLLTNAENDGLGGGYLYLEEDVGFVEGDAYAVTANLAFKMLDFNYRWSLPGLNYVDYDMAIMQVKENIESEFQT